MVLTRFGLKGLVFYAMLVAAFYAAPYLNLFFMLLAFASVLAVLNFYWGWRNVARIHGRLVDPAPVAADTQTPARLAVWVTRRHRYDLTASLAVDGVDTPIARNFAIDSAEEQIVTVDLPPLARGIHPVNRLRIESVHPFGAIRWRRTLSAPCELVVYPKPADLAAYRDRNGSHGQGALGGDATTEMGPAGLREFRLGDDMRNVHWKASARRNDLVIRELEGDSSPGVEAVLDLRTTSETLEESLSLAAGLVLECRENKELFTLHSQDHSRTYGEGHAAFDELFDYLARVQALPADGPPPPATSPGVLRLPLANRRLAEVAAP